MTTATATTNRFPAGPRGAPLIGNMRDFMRDPRDFLTRCAREYGDAVLLLATIAQRVHFTLVPGQTIVPMASITLRPKNGVKVIVNKR